MPVAYSYLRFSSPKQAEGDSLRRQNQNRESWLADHPAVHLDASLALEDRGRSAFKRTNWDTYALARFVDCVKSGRVEPGSYLLVENLDRLSREDAGEATELFLSIVNKGVVIVQLAPEVTEFRKPVDMLNLMRAIVELSRGHSESAIKSTRCRAAWERKNREAATRIVTRKLPGWVRQDGARLVLDPAGAATVRRAFALARDGHSALAVARLFNVEKVPVLGRKQVKGRAVLWSAPIVYQILTSRAAVGEYIPYKTTRRPDKPTGEPVRDYYPAAVDEDTFHAVRGALATRGAVGRGRRGRHVNLFAGILKDARDGGSVSYCHRRDSCELIPVEVKHGRGSGWASFPAATFERAVLSQLAEVRAEDVDGGGGDAARRVEVIAGEHADAEQKVKWYQARCDEAKTREDFEVFAGKALEWGRRRKELAAALAAAQREAASPIAETWGEFRSLADLLGDGGADDLRLKVRSALRRSVEGIHCLFVGRRVRIAAARVQFRNSESHRDYLITYTPGRSNQNVKRPPTWSVLSFAAAGLPALDLRDPAGVAKVEKLLSALDVSNL